MIDIVSAFFRHSKAEQAEFKNKIQDEKLKGHRGEIDVLARQLRDLEKRHEQLKLVTLAMWTLLRDHSGLMEADLKKYVEKIDLMDGQRDGKATVKRERVNCNTCGRFILNTAIICAYCGTYTNAKPIDVT